MDVVLSWSGPQSRKVAEAFREWLSGVLPGAKPWISTEDIGVGTQWFPSLMKQLETASSCVICLTPQNVRSPWLYFEAGAIAASGSIASPANQPTAKRSDHARVCAYLIGVSGSQLMGGPLSQFQWTEATKEGTWKLLREINRRLPTAHDETLLEGNFNQRWPWLKRKLDTALTDSENGEDRGPAMNPLPAVYELTLEAERLLVEAAKDQRGTVLMVMTMHGLTVQTNGKQMVESQEPRSRAAWKAAVRQLLQAGLLESRGSKGEVLSLTAEGFRIADELKKKKASETNTPA